MSLKASPRAKGHFRFADIGKLPNQMLAPIEGYGSEQCVTLEEAVKPLIDVVPNIERNVYVVKQDCHMPEDGLTPDESAAIRLYTLESYPREHALFFILNQLLRSQQRNRFTDWFLYLRLLLSALCHLPASASRLVYRGVRGKLQDDYPPGKTFIWWAFSSCTKTKEVLEQNDFLGTDGPRIQFDIECETGKDISKHSFYPKEHEVLLFPARKFKVISREDRWDGLCIIRLREIPTPHSLIELPAATSHDAQPRVLKDAHYSLVPDSHHHKPIHSQRELRKISLPLLLIHYGRRETLIV